MPALPYFVIMITAIAMTFVMDLPKISIESIPFKLALPIPHFSGMGGAELSILLLKMVGFAMMLGTIDVIEQVMSNVAIEKMDPLDRACDTNNSLLAIWIANLGATFFGGMTNLDGLAKSTTNTVAGAMTKLSNLFTSAFLFLVVLFPVLITTLPEYALGIIMVYSGWKMIANISHVKAEGRYALILAAVCGLLVFKLGIFEGLLIVLAAHALIQFVFMKRLGKSNQEIWDQFKSSFSEKPVYNLESEDILADPQVPVYNKLIHHVNTKNLDGVLSLYHDNAVLVPSFSSRIRRNKEEVKDYFETLFKMDNLILSKKEVYLNETGGQRIDSGVYEIFWDNSGSRTSYDLNFMLVVENDKIIAHQSSYHHSNNISISRWVDEKEKGSFVM